MRYSADHKEKTRNKLLEAARKQFREHGFDNLSIDKLMKGAGLTRGAFYAHFDSKEALITEVLRLESGLLRQLRAVEPGDAARERAATHFDQYLDPAERDALIYCPLVAHPMDALRGGTGRQELYAAQVRGLIDAVREIVGDEEEAILITVLSVGAAILSSATPDADAASRIEEVCRDEIRKRLDTET